MVLIISFLEKGGVFGETTDEKTNKKEQFLIRPTDEDTKILNQIKSKQNSGMKQKLLMMGFDEYEIEKALDKFDNLNSAIEYLSGGGSSAERGTIKEVKVDEQMVQQIIMMGFSREEAIQTLKMHENNLEMAINSLLG